MSASWAPPRTPRTTLIIAVVVVIAIVLALNIVPDQIGEFHEQELSGNDIISDLEKRQTFFLSPPLPVRSAAGIARLLQNDDPRVQSAALDMLEALGPSAANALPTVIAIAASGDRFIRLRAITILPALGDGAVQALPVLRDALLDADPEIRIRAAEALRGLPAIDKETLTIVGKVVNATEPRVRVAAARVLGSMHSKVGITGDLLAEMLRHSDSGVKLQATLALADRANDDAVNLVPELIKALSDPVAAIRWSAADAMVKNAPAFAPFANELLGNTEPEERRLALRILSRLPVVSDETFIAVYGLLKAKEPSVRLDALSALASWDTRSADAWAQIEAALDDPEPNVRRQALKTLQVLAIDPIEIVEHAVVALGDPGPAVKATALKILTESAAMQTAALPRLLPLVGQPGTTSSLKPFFRAMGEPAIEHLARRLGYGAPAERSAIIGILSDPEFASVQVIAILQRALGDQDPMVRQAVVKGLATFAKKDRNALTALSDAVRDTDPAVKDTAITSLGQLAEDYPPALAVWAKAVADDPERILSAFYWLKGINLRKGQADALIEPLQSLLNDNDVRKRQRAAEILRRIGAVPERSVWNESEALPSEAYHIVSKLKLALSKGGEDVIGNALDDFMRVGQPIPDALPHLEQLLTHDNHLHRIAAAEALVGLYGRTEGAGGILIEGLATDKLETTAKTSYLLSKLGKQALPAATKLLQKLQTGTEIIERREALSTLLSIGVDVIPVLRNELQKPAEGYRFAAAYVLGQMGSAASSSVPELVLLAHDVDQPTALRAEAIRALGSIGADDATTVQALADVLRENPAEAERRAFGAFTDPLIRQSGERNKEMFEVLDDDTRWTGLLIGFPDLSLNLRYAASESLGRIGADAGSATPILVDLANGRVPPPMAKVRANVEITSLFVLAFANPSSLVDRSDAKNITQVKRLFALALLATVATLLVLQFPWMRSNKPYLVRVVGPSVGFSAAFLVFAANFGAHILYATLALIPFVFASMISNLTAPPRWIIRAWWLFCLTAAVPLIVMSWQLDIWSPQPVLAVVFAAFLVLVWASSSVLTRRAPGIWQWPSWIAVTIGLTTVLLQAGSPPQLILGAIVLVMFIGCFWMVALFIPWHGWERSMLDVMIIVWFSAIIVGGALLSLPLFKVVLIAAAPLAGWIGDGPGLRRLPALPRQFLRAAAVVGVTISVVLIGQTGPVTPGQSDKYGRSSIKKALRIKTLDTLVDVGTSPEVLLPVAENALAERFSYGGPALADAAARAMAVSGQQGRNRLIQLIGEYRYYRRAAIAKALANANVDTEPAITALNRVVRNTDYRPNDSDLLALAALDPSPETLTMLLQRIDTLTTEINNERDLIPLVDALKYFVREPERVLPALANILDGPFESSPVVAAKVAGEFGPAAAKLGHKIVILPTQDKPLRRYTLVIALGRLGPNAAYAAPFLVDTLTADEDPAVQAAAAWALGEIKHESAEAMEALVAAVSNHNFAYSPEVRTAATKALRRLQPASLP